MQSRYINSKEIYRHWYDNVGDYNHLLNSKRELRVSHKECDDGLPDQRKRLYIRVTDDGEMLLAYCHNCGRKGHYRFQDQRNIRARLVNTPAVGYTTSHAEVLSDQVFDIWRAHIKSIGGVCDSCENHVTQSYPEANPAWCTPHKLVAGVGLMKHQWISLFIPSCFDKFGDPKLISIKSKSTVKPDDQSYPKWTHHWRNDISLSLDGGYPPIIDNPGRSIVTLVEDRISALWLVQEAPEISVCTLNGTHLNEDYLFKIACLYPDGIILWLDSDEAGRNASKNIERQLELFTPKVIESSRIEPKMFKTRGIIELLHGCVKTEIQNLGNIS